RSWWSPRSPAARGRPPRRRWPCPICARTAATDGGAMTSFSLAGRQALVTGASRGIGARLAVGLAEAGADVVVTARRAEDLAETVHAIDRLGRRSLAIACDVSGTASIAAAAAAIADAGWQPDILVNNAGHESVRPSVDVDEETWDRIVDTNLKGAF